MRGWLPQVLFLAAPLVAGAAHELPQGTSPRGQGAITYAMCDRCPAPRIPKDKEPQGGRGVRETVLLRVLITDRGEPTEIQVLNPANDWLDQNAIETIKGWRFKPARDLNGKAVVAWSTVELNYRLRPGWRKPNPAVLAPQGTSLEAFVKQFAGDITQRSPRRVVLAGSFRCKSMDCLEVQIPVARGFAEALRHAGSSLQFVPEDEQLTVLRQDGFLSIDLHFPEMARYIAHRLGADAYITGEVQRSGDDLEVQLEARGPADNRSILRREIRLPSGMFTNQNRAPIVDESGVYVPAVGGVIYPVCQKCPRPEYTEQAYKDKVQGQTYFVITVDVTGRPSEPRPIVGLPGGLLERSIGAVRGWTFQPATLNGKPVPSRCVVEVSFYLH